MIRTLVILALCVLSTVEAQSLSDLPQCGVSSYFSEARLLKSNSNVQQTCISNMFNIATSQFGCAVGNVTCYCTVQDFGYGVRDCANEACPNQQDAAEVIAFGAAYCENACTSSIFRVLLQTFRSLLGE